MGADLVRGFVVAGVLLAQLASGSSARAEVQPSAAQPNGVPVSPKPGARPPVPPPARRPPAPPQSQRPAMVARPLPPARAAVEMNARPAVPARNVAPAARPPMIVRSTTPAAPQAGARAPLPMQTQRPAQVGTAMRPALPGQTRAPLPGRPSAVGVARLAATRPPLPQRLGAPGATSGMATVASRSQSTGALPLAQRSLAVGGGSAQPASYSASAVKAPAGRPALPQRPGAAAQAAASLGVMKRDGAQLTVFGCQRQGAGGGDVACDTEYGNLDQSQTQITKDGWNALYAIDGDGNKYPFASATLQMSDGTTRDSADVLYGHAMRYVIYFSGVPAGAATLSLVQPGDKAQSVADVAVEDDAAPVDDGSGGGKTADATNPGDDGTDKKAADGSSSKPKSTGAKLKKVAKDAVKEAVKDAVKGATEAVLGDDDGASDAAPKKK